MFWKYFQSDRFSESIRLLELGVLNSLAGCYCSLHATQMNWYIKLGNKA